MWNKKEEEFVPQTFTPEDVKAMLDKKPVKQRSSLCAVLYGHDGVGKSGAAMDCRNEQEVKDGKQVIVIDLDGSAGPLMKYFEYDENMKILDPIILTMKGDIDYVTSYNKVLAITKYLLENEDSLNLHAVILDGLDSLLKMCEYVMRFEDLKKDPDTQIKDSWQWARRNRRYLTVVLLLKRLRCDKFFTTHFKELKQWKGGELSTIGFRPIWEKSTPGVMFQKIRLERNDTEGGITLFEAKVEKAKGALHLEGRSFPLAEVTPGKTTWIGLKELYDELRG